MVLVVIMRKNVNIQKKKKRNEKESQFSAVGVGRKTFNTQQKAPAESFQKSARVVQRFTSTLSKEDMNKEKIMLNLHSKKARNNDANLFSCVCFIFGHREKSKTTCWIFRLAVYFSAVWHSKTNAYFARFSLSLSEYAFFDDVINKLTIQHMIFNKTRKSHFSLVLNLVSWSWISRLLFWIIFQSVLFVFIFE